MVSSSSASGGGAPVRQELRGAQVAEWTTVTLEASPGAPPSDALDDRIRNPRTSGLTVGIEIVADPSSGATAWCDEATLTLMNGAQ